MARTLADVIHHWLPEPIGEEQERGDPPPPVAQACAVLPVVCSPVGPRDVVRAALLWNLTVEVSRLGGRAVLVAPDGLERSPAWPAPGPGPIDTELALVPATGLGALGRAAFDIAVDRAAGSLDGGIVLVQIPPRWLLEPADAGSLLRWTLVLATPDARDLAEAHGIAKLVRGADPHAEVGITIHGVRRRQEAEQAFGRLARAAQRHLGVRTTSYGMLVDDLAVYRAIVAHRPVGLAHPQSTAARALRDVASLLLESARERALA